MWVGTLQFWNVWMGHGIIPPHLLVMVVNFVGILENTLFEEIDLFKNTQGVSSVKLDLTT